jgi:hypothetical protein
MRALLDAKLNPLGDNLVQIVTKRGNVVWAN